MSKEVDNIIDDTKEIHKVFDTILILDFGSQYSHLIVRRLRDLNVYSELQPCTINLDDLNFRPKGIILSGGPYSVYDKDAPHVDKKVFEKNIPILGICYGLQEIAWQFGQDVISGEKREYGPAIMTVNDNLNKNTNSLFQGLSNKFKVWMSHGDKLSKLPKDFLTIARSENAPFAGIAHTSNPWWGIQFHPEVSHTDNGSQIFKNFVELCNCAQNWTMDSFIVTELKQIRDTVGETAQVIGAVSGGVDSTVAAKLIHQAIGKRFHAVLVDNGLLRENEAINVYNQLSEHLKMNLQICDASDIFLSKLKGIVDPEEKRKIVGNEFIYCFERQALQINQTSGGNIDFLLQGTLYPDVIESISFKGPSQTIKSHHNVGGLLKDMKLKLIEPLRELFKDEVRILGIKLGLSPELIWRHPFPGPGLSIRILGEVTAKQLEILRKADSIYIDEIRKGGYYSKISQAFAVLLPVRSVGVQGDKRTYEQIIALRAINSLDFMSADWYADFSVDFLKKVSSRICNEVKGVNRVVYDISSKPPATVEWE